MTACRGLATTHFGVPALLAALVAAALGSVAIRAPRAAAAGAGERLVIVNVGSSAEVSPVVTHAHALGLSVRTTLPKIGAVSVRVPAIRLAAVVQQLRSQPGVQSVEIAAARRLAETPNDPKFGAYQSSYLNAVTAPSAWSVQHGSAAVRIAVVDSGVDVTHPDLAGKIVGRYNAKDNSTTVTDQLGHGTFVAGVAAAATNNGIGVAGAGYDSGILAVKVDNGDGSGSIPLDYANEGIIWAADHGARVINCSFAGEYASTSERNAISYAQSMGAIVVAAAGNEAQYGNPVEYPAAYPQVIAVGATDAAGHRTSFSEYGSWVSVAAPGVHIYSTTPLAGSTFFGPTYASGAGTSFSSPIVAGEVALLAAQSPTASAAALRAAVVDSAHGYAGLGLGTGQVDFAAALNSLTPTTVPAVTAPLDAATESGAVAVTATSTAPKVQFRIDGSALGSPVPVVSGVASASWISYGAANGTHTLTAADCGQGGACNTTTDSRTFTLANEAPTLTSPVSGQGVTGTFSLSAAAPGGGVALLVDGARVAFDGTAPYEVSYEASSLADGAHEAVAVSCSASGATCLGPSSAPVAFTSVAVHAALTSIAPSPFSPNGDGRNDLSRATFTLPESAFVSVRVLTQTGALVRGPLYLGTLSAGPHSWVWNGRTNAFTRAADGMYTVRLSASRQSADGTVAGAVTGSVRLDTTVPGLSSVWGNGAVFYPVRDGYRDTFGPSATLSEAATLRLYVYSPGGHLVRALGAAKSPGRVGLTWDGRDSANRLVSPATYRWRFTATDAAGNVRATPMYYVTAR